jgi:hypothetical protein
MKLGRPRSFLKISVFWDVAPRSLVKVNRRFKGAHCPHIISLMMEAANNSETSLSFYQATRRNSPQHNRFPTRRCEIQPISFVS